MESRAPFRRLARQGYQIFRRRRVIESFVLGSSILLPVFLVAIATGILLRYRPISGWVVPLLALGAVAAGVTVAIRYGMRHRFTYPQFLRHLERRLDLHRNELINADELEAELGNIEDPLSRGLAAQAVDEGRSRLDSVSFPTLSKARNLRVPALRVLAGAGAMILLAVVAPDGFRASLDRLFAPGTFELPPAFQISVLPGDVTIPRGATVRVQALVPEDSKGAQLVYRAKGGGWKSVEMRPAGTADEEGAVRQSYQFTLAGLSEDTEYAVSADRSRSQSYQIGVTEPLRAQNFKKTITPPAYTGLAATDEVALDGNFSAVVGSRATLTVNSSRPDARGRLIFEEGDAVPMQSHGDGVLVADLMIKESSRYRVELTDPSLPGMDYNSSIYRIEASPDRLPTLYQLAPERSIHLPPEMTVELDADCLDDFGLTRLDLVYQRNDKPAQRVNLASWQGEREARVVYPWDLEGVAIAPGDVVRYHLELTDNDAISGPKTANGPECEVRFPALEEMYADVNEDREEQQADVQDMVESQKHLQEELDKALHDVKANKDLSWEKQEGLKDLAARQEQLTQKLEDLSKSLDNSLEQMQQADLFSPEMMEKVQQISELVKQIQDPEFQKQIEELRKALEKMDKKAVERTLEQMQMSQTDLEQSLDRTLKLLQKMQTEEHLDQVVKETQRLLEQQERLNQDMERAQQDPQDPQESEPKQNPSDSAEQKASESKTSESKASEQKPSEQKPSEQDQAENQDGQQSEPQPLDPKEASELQKKQDELKKELEKLQEELAKLEQEAKENWEQLKQEMEKNEPQAQAESAKKKMEQAAGQMGKSQNNKKQSLQFGRQAESEMKQLSQQMQEMQQNLEQKDQEEIVRELFAISGKLVNLSQNQEYLLEEAPSHSAREIAERQASIADGGKRTLDDLYELGKKSQFLSPDLAKSMGQAVQSLDGSTRAFEQGNRQSAMAQGHASTNTMNETVIELLETNQKMCNSASNGACKNPMGKMRSLSAQQEQLNGESQGMMGQTPRLSESQGEQQRLEELAARQEMIRRGLDEVGGALEGRKDVLGRLDDLGKEMEELAEEMRERGSVDERILERQQKILSRLLTAQKSIRREDFDDERIARTGVNPEDRESPPPLTDELSGDDLLRRGILRGSQDPVPDEFRSLVDDYFQSLSEQKK